MELASALAEKARTDQVEWSINDDGAYCVVLPGLQILVMRVPEKENGPDVIFEVDSADGRELGAIHVKNGEAEFSTISELLSNADAYASQWNRLIKTTAESIKHSSGSVGGVVRTLTTTPAPPPPPQRPTDQQAADFFKKIAGKWLLDYSSGLETLTIDENGNYFVLNKNAPENLRHAFRIVLISCDAELQHLEMAKQELSGKIRQIEMLTVTPNSMEGFAKHDQHKLLYKRL